MDLKLVSRKVLSLFSFTKSSPREAPEHTDNDERVEKQTQPAPERSASQKADNQTNQELATIAAASALNLAVIDEASDLAEGMFPTSYGGGGDGF